TGQLVVLEHGNGQHGSKTAQLDARDDDRISIDVALIQHDVGGMNRPPGRDEFRKAASRRGTKLRFTPAKLGKGGRSIMQRAGVKPFSVVEIKGAELAFADARGIRPWPRTPAPARRANWKSLAGPRRWRSAAQ